MLLSSVQSNTQHLHKNDKTCQFKINVKTNVKIAMFVLYFLHFRLLQERFNLAELLVCCRHHPMTHFLA